MKVFEVALILEQDVTSGATLNFMCVCGCMCVHDRTLHVCVCLYLQEELVKQHHTLHTTSRRLTEAEAANSNSKEQLGVFQTALELTNSVKDGLKEQLESKEDVLQNKNNKNKQQQRLPPMA